MTVVVIGGDAAGMSLASRIHRKSPDTEVIIFEKSNIVSYGACGLPFYIGGINNDINRIMIRKPESFVAEGLDLRVYHEVTAVDPDAKTVTVKNVKTGEVLIQKYDKLAVCSGSRPIVPPIEGKELKGVYSLRTVPDAERLKEEFSREDVKRIAIVGGGFIGLELCDAAVERGKTPLLFEALPHVMTTYDEDFQTALEAKLESNGVELHLGEPLKKINGEGAVKRVVSDKGEFDADLVVFAIGVKPNTEMLPDSHFKKLRNGALVINDSMETGVPDVYAAGDCTTVYNMITKKQDYIALGSNANKQGRFAADVIMGKEVHFDNALGTSIIRVKNFEMGKTGISEREAIANGFDYGTCTVTRTSHAPYYVKPEGANLTAKIVYDKKSKVLLGAQIMGEYEAAMRINIFACAINCGMTTKELGKLDMAYSPSFTRPWDIVHVVCNAAK